MIYLVILNTLAIIYLFATKNSRLSLEFRKEVSSRNKTLLGFSVMLWNKHNGRRIIHIPIRDAKKTEMREEALYMIAKYSYQNKLQSLGAMFSWLRTWEEVKEFQKYYTIVDEKIVNDLVSKFVPKK